MSKPRSVDRLAQRERPRGHHAVMYQKWRDLLFLHWRYDPQVIQHTLPPGLSVDTFEGQAFVGVVPFFMRDVRPRFAPPVRGISRFQELNLRTYVHDERGVPGVWFYSLDADQWLAVRIARLFFHLPYFYARMKARKDPGGGEIFYTSWRQGADPRLESRFRYKGHGATHRAEAGSLAFFLLERYVLFSYSPRRGRLYTGRVHHPPYPIREAQVRTWDDHLLALDGFARPGRPPDHVVMSPGVDVEVFRLEETPK